MQTRDEANDRELNTHSQFDIKCCYKFVLFWTTSLRAMNIVQRTHIAHRTRTQKQMLNAPAERESASWTVAYSAK